MTRTTLLAALAGAAALSACSFGAKPPPTLMRLSPDAAAPAGPRTAQTAQAITVVPPAVPQELMTMRVPVRESGTQVTYLPKAQWVEMPNTMFARLLSDTIAAKTGRVVLDPRQFTFDPGQRLTGTLQEFGFEETGSQAVVIYDAAIARGATAVETRRFEARVPVAAIDAASAPAALNRAANDVAAQVAAWV
ncbi:MAG TPA: ABC-type transport auxiliary lipoprotein family protein, partial [Allosphingosinicella sp.]|nr:ABC-type transport auxiliary lipoprotein family protein [Allosphingosinicella sp.]